MAHDDSVFPPHTRTIPVTTPQPEPASSTVIWQPQTGGGYRPFGDGGPADAGDRTWRQELPRWLASLNPGRTRREYEKAVSYFFQTPGVPEALRELTFDLLLAYRGALALRATAPRDRRAAARARPPTAPSPLLANAARPALPETDAEEGAPPADAASSTTPAPTPLAPATVNIRLTALRQFLCHCSLSGSLPQLSPDRVRAALRRLSVERRRPYQILAEPEWEEFLEAARAPLAVDHDPWGVPHARRGAAQQAEEQSRLARSRAGLTGARTAQRDYALVAMALATGLRAVELSELDVGDLSREYHAGREEWWLVLPDAKTKGQRGGRNLPLAPSLIEAIQAYLRVTGRTLEHATDRATPLFLSAGRRRAHPTGEPSTGDGSGEQREYRRLSPGDIGRIVDRVEAQWLALRGGTGEAGARRGDTRAISPHALRHSTAVALLEGNEAMGRAPASVEHVRGWLGHFDIRTTQGYLAHLEGRRHRRPFALSLPVEPSQAEPRSGSADNPRAGEVR